MKGKLAQDDIHGLLGHCKCIEQRLRHIRAHLWWQDISASACCSSLCLHLLHLFLIHPLVSAVHCHCSVTAHSLPLFPL